jgi:Ca-activated chloride channel family protein
MPREDEKLVEAARKGDARAFEALYEKHKGFVAAVAARLRIVSFFTDGFIGNEEQVPAAVREKLGPSRIFSFGVGPSVNRYLIEGLARIGRGAVAYVGPGDSDGAAVDRFFERIARPALTDVSFEWEGIEVSDVYPKRVPDLFVGRPVVVAGKFEGDRKKASLKVSGTVAGERRTMSMPFRPAAGGEAGGGLSKIWARARIAELSDRRAVDGPSESAEKIRSVALEHGLLSDYTAFLAVDGTRRTEGSGGTTVAVPVPVPEGVRYDTTVTGN